MTLNGWLQILLFFACVLALTKPLGVYMTKVFARERTWLDPVFRPLEKLIYKLTAVDVSSRPELGASFLNEAGYDLMRKGDVIFTDFPRVYQDQRSIFGVSLVVDRTDGSRVRDSLYYHKGKLYIAEAVVLPTRGNKDMTIPGRYDQTIRFPPDGRFD